MRVFCGFVCHDLSVQFRYIYKCCYNGQSIINVRANGYREEEKAPPLQENVNAVRANRQQAKTQAKNQLYLGTITEVYCAA